MLIISLFLALILSIWLKIKPNNFIIEFPKSMIKPPCLWNGSYKISPVHLSTCLSIRLSVTHFSQDCSVGFLNFLHKDILPDILKSDKAEFWKIVLCK